MSPKPLWLGVFNLLKFDLTPKKKKVKKYEAYFERWSIFTAQGYAKCGIATASRSSVRLYL